VSVAVVLLTDDPEIPSKQNHRAFLKEQVVFKEVRQDYTQQIRELGPDLHLGLK
jgi:hypothetical protein